MLSAHTISRSTRPDAWPSGLRKAPRPNPAFNISCLYYFLSREMAQKSKRLRRDGGAYPKSGGLSTLMPRLPVLCVFAFSCLLLGLLPPSLFYRLAGSLLGSPFCRWLAARWLACSVVLAGCWLLCC